MTDERLFETEWPFTVDMELSVPEDIVDSGRMYSTCSEKPTRAREGGRCKSSESTLGDVKPWADEGEAARGESDRESGPALADCEAEPSLSMGEMGVLDARELEVESGG